MRKKVVLGAALVAVLAALACFAYLSTFTRLHADDYCIAADVTHLDPAAYFLKWYTQWTGRFAYITFTGLLTALGAGFAAWLPTLTLGVWLVGLSWALAPLARWVKWDHPRLCAWIAAGLILLVLYAATPNLFQSAFWEIGLINYSFPLVGFTWAGGVLVRLGLGQIQPKPAAAWVGGLSFLSGGFTEAFSSVQVAFYVLLLVGAAVWGRGSARRALLSAAWAGLLGGGLALGVILASPGNEVRRDALPEPPGLIRLVTFSIRNAAYIMGKYFLWTPGWAALSVGVPLAAGWAFGAGHAQGARGARLSWRLPWVQAAGVMLTAGFGLAVAACAPVVYSLNAYPDDRTIFLPLFFWILALTVSSTLLGSGLRGLGVLSKWDLHPRSTQAAAGLALAGLMLAAGVTGWRTAQAAPEYRQYAQDWDRRDAQLRALSQSGVEEVTVVGLPSRFGVADLQESPDHWVNRCMAEYYGIPQLRGR